MRLQTEPLSLPRNPPLKKLLLQLLPASLSAACPGSATVAATRVSARTWHPSNWDTTSKNIMRLMCLFTEGHKFPTV